MILVYIMLAVDSSGVNCKMIRKEAVQKCLDIDPNIKIHTNLNIKCAGDENISYNRY